MAFENFPFARLGLDKSLEEVRADMFNRLDEVHGEYQAQGLLPAALNLNRGPMRGMIELGNWGRWQLNRDITELIPQCFPLYATGPWLDLHAASVMLERKSALQARGTVIFTRNRAGNIRIPAGRLVRTKPDGLGEIFRFVTTTETVLPESDESVSVPAIAENYGQAANVTAGAICEIVTSIDGIGAVTNAVDWLTAEGADEESDHSLRRRYFLRWMSISGLNKYFYESLALGVPGVDAARVHDRHPRGQGTVDVYVKGSAGLPTPGLLSQVTEVIEAEKPQIDDFLVLAPTPMPVDVTLTLEITQGEPAALAASVENRLRALFHSPVRDIGVPLLNIGEDLTHSRLTHEGMKSRGIKRVLIESPAADLDVGFGGLAMLNSLAIETVAAET